MARLFTGEVAVLWCCSGVASRLVAGIDADRVEGNAGHRDSRTEEQRWSGGVRRTGGTEGSDDGGCGTYRHRL